MSKSKKIKIVEKTGNTRKTVIDSSLLNQDVKSPSWRFNRRDKEFPIKLYEDEVFSLRINGKHRLIGILEDGVFYVIWNDKEHDICASSKRNT